MFIRNAWYVAAWSEEIGRELRAITLLGEAVVFYRTSQGEVVALEDACPHRKLPLSMGRLIDDDVQCGYHGLTFDALGRCVRAPLMSAPPVGAAVRSYVVAERYGLVWIWPGDPDLADPRQIIGIDHYGEDGWGLNAGASMVVDCHYLYMTDNLLDPSHVAWVHQGSFGNAACEDIPSKAEPTDGGVIVSRWMIDVDVAPFYSPFVRFEGRCDRKQHYEVRLPAHAVIRAIFAPTRTGAPDGALHADTFLLDSYNFLTPIDAQSTRYFWFQLRNTAPDDEDVSERLGHSVREAFEEDRLVLNAVQRGMASRRTPNINLAIDAGPMRFRRLVDQAIRQEVARSARPRD